MKSMTSDCGQVSLEFLLVLAAFAGLLLALMPAFTHALTGVQFAADVTAAASFSRVLVAKAEQLAFLGNGSQFVLSAHPRERWELVLHENGNSLRVHYQGNTHSLPLPLALDANVRDLVGLQSLTIEKTQDGLRIHD